MKVTANLNGVRLPPRKVRAVAALIRGKMVDDALAQLSILVRRPTSPLSKLIQSAIANGENTYRMVRSNLYVKELTVNEGVKLKRFMPRAQGRATEIQKKTSRIHVVLEEKEIGIKQDAVSSPKHTHEPEHAAPAAEETAGAIKKPEVKRELGQKKENLVGRLGRKIFNRKAI